MEDKNDKLNCQNSEEVEFKTEHIDESAEVKATEQSEESLETDPLSNMTFADDNEDNEYGYDGDYFEDDREKRKNIKKKIRADTQSL